MTLLVVHFLLVFFNSVTVATLLVLKLTELTFIDQGVFEVLKIAVFEQLLFDMLGRAGIMMLHAQLDDYFVETLVLLFHFLVVASTLLSLSTTDEGRHRLEYFVSSTQLFVYEVVIVLL